jgi:hypothetical protein
MHAVRHGGRIWGTETYCTGSQLSKPRDNHAPIYALHCLEYLCFNKNLFRINLLKKYMVVFYISVDNLSFKVGKPWRPGNSLRKH